MSSAALKKFEQHGASETELLEAIERLGPVVELPARWSAIANDQSLPLYHRRLAVAQFITRHIVRGLTSCGEFARMLDGARWIDHDGIVIVDALGGKIPVTSSPDSTVVSIPFLDNSVAVYLAIAGRVSADEIAGLLLRNPDYGHLATAVIRDVAIEPFL